MNCWNGIQHRATRFGAPPMSEPITILLDRIQSLAAQVERQSIAWSYGHSGGYQEVANRYAKLVELIAP